MQSCRWLLVLAGLLGAADRAVIAEGGGALGAEVLLGDAHCASDEAHPSVAWIEDPQTFRDLYQDLVERVDSTITVPRIDFAREGVLRIAMGQQPTAGYGLGFQPGAARLEQDVLEVEVVWQKPPPDAILPQVITHPCLLLRLPAVAFSRIRILDQDGRVRITAVR